MEKLKKWIEDNILDKNGNPKGKHFNFKLKHGDLKCLEIVKKTSFLGKKTKMSERIFCINHILYKRLECLHHNCKKNVKFINYQYGYNKHCSQNCSNKKL